jgi:dipeptidyl aminopeptidase/acylaminoacyl peptidase
MKILPIVFAVIAATTGCTVQAAPPAAPDARRLSIEQLIDIRHPSNPAWAPDGRHVVFISERAGIANLYVADTDGRGTPARPLTKYQDGQVGGVFWSRDAQIVYFSRGGHLWQLPVAGGEPEPVWSGPAPETGLTPSPDGTRVAFVRGTDLWVRSLGDGKEIRLAHDDKSVGGAAWSPDGAHLLFSAGADTIRHEETPAYSGAKIVYTITERTPGQMFVVAAPAAPAASESAAGAPRPVDDAGGKPVPIGAPVGFGGARWIDGHRLVFDRTSSDFKRRTTYVADVSGGLPRVVHEDVDERFSSIPGDAGAGPLPSPDGKWIAFVSDRDGWDHVYVMPAPAEGASGQSPGAATRVTGDDSPRPVDQGGGAVQITKGKFEAWRPSWSPDSARLAFDANEPDRPGDRHLGVATIGSDPSHAAIVMITAGHGTDIAPSWSPDGKRLVYQHTDSRNSADLFVVDAAANAKPARLSDSMPASIDRSGLVEPEFVHYAGPDGQSVPGWLFVPKGLDRTTKHPAVVWIHGDGINQNYDGWHVQRNYAVYYSFHQYLLQKGYVVFAPDYRGSIGYGRAWRQGVYMDVGGNDAKDAWMAANYLKTLGYVDTDRVGVWGLSYGGFFTLIAVTDQPRLFRAAVDVAGVVDYTMYYDDPYHGSWTASRIGTPEQNPKVYAQASPLSHVDRLERPLLILHGTSDVNVPYLHSVRLIDELMKKGKGGLVSFMAYPGEFHYFTRQHVLRDAWHRVEDFFDANLAPNSTATHEEADLH